MLLLWDFGQSNPFRKVIRQEEQPLARGRQHLLVPGSGFGQGSGAVAPWAPCPGAVGLQRDVVVLSQCWLAFWVLTVGFTGVLSITNCVTGCIIWENMKENVKETLFSGFKNELLVTVAVLPQEQQSHLHLRLQGERIAIQGCRRKNSGHV